MKKTVTPTTTLPANDPEGTRRLVATAQLRAAEEIVQWELRHGRITRAQAVKFLTEAVRRLEPLVYADVVADEKGRVYALSGRRKLSKAELARAIAAISASYAEAEAMMAAEAASKRRARR